MVTIAVPLLVVLLVTSQYLHAYPSASDMKDYRPMNLRLKRDFGYLQHHDLANKFNDDLPLNMNENLPYLYSMIQQRQNRKRLIDF